MKIAWIGVALLVGAGALWWVTKPPAPADSSPSTEPEEKEEVRTNPNLADSGLYIPDEEELEDEEEAAPEKAPPPKTATPKAAALSWDCAGELPVASVRQVIQANQSAVRACYERQLRENNTLQGKLQVRLRIAYNGEVNGVQVGGSLRDSKVRSCVRALAKKWKFPNTTHGCAVVVAPFDLSPRN